jgi:hypothetical protein
MVKKARRRDLSALCADLPAAIKAGTKRIGRRKIAILFNVTELEQDEINAITQKLGVSKIEYFLGLHRLAWPVVMENKQ